MPGNNRRSERRRHNNAPGRPPSAISERTDSRVERTAVFGKTKMCKFYILGVCARGSDCAFAHDATEMNQMPDLSRTKICKTLINTGDCDDPECTYAHNKEELRSVPGVSGGAKGGGEGYKAPVNANAIAQGQHANPMAAGIPPAFAGPSLDPAQALALQQWMAMQMSQMQMMAAAAQSQAQGQNAPNSYNFAAAALAQGAAPGQPFLYDALFQGGGNPAGAFAAAMAGTPQPSTASSSQAQPLTPQAKAPSSSAPKKVPRPAKADLVKKVERPGGTTINPCCPMCGYEFLPDANFCRGCGQKRPAAVANPVPYKVKNTFIDVQDSFQGSPLGGLRTVQSAAGCLYSIAGDTTPHLSDDGSPTANDGGGAVNAQSSPMMVPSIPSYAISNPPLGNGPISANDSSTGFGLSLLTLPKTIPRCNTFNSDLAVLDEDGDAEDKEDIQFLEGMEAMASGPAGSASSEKRLQDTPLGEPVENLNPNGEEGRDPLGAGSDEPFRDEPLSPRANSDEFLSRSRAGSGAMEDFVVKNTFLEYKQEKPVSGMRMVQTASGRLDLMSQE